MSEFRRIDDTDHNALRTSETKGGHLVDSTTEILDRCFRNYDEGKSPSQMQGEEPGRPKALTGLVVSHRRHSDALKTPTEYSRDTTSKMGREESVNETHFRSTGRPPTL